MLRPGLASSKPLFMGSAPPARLDAFENYIRGILAGTSGEKVSHFREATRLNPGYSEAWLQLGKAHFEQRNFDQAIDALHHVSDTDTVAQEANFYLGLSAYRVGDFSAAQSAFAFVAARLPLTEVDNNLGVVTARLGDQRRAADKFRKAVEQDPNDPDYHFNLGITLYRIGNAEGGVQQLQKCLDLRPNDAEAKSTLAVWSRNASAESVPSGKVDIPPRKWIDGASRARIR